MFKGIAGALASTIETARPGLRACDLDRELRRHIERLGGSFPHHSGHGIGVTWHEEPRIVPYNTLPLEAGMVIAIGPGIYFEGRRGIRLEDTVLVTPTGAQVLSAFRHAFEQA